MWGQGKSEGKDSYPFVKTGREIKSYCIQRKDRAAPF